ncbi:hypothetical protein TGGT1_297300 [Toxoplasma gondii GT1]|uniref:Uncharacterized protein n=6 Tax=Toxoplasma gondii TaxID=5811 RepID=S7UKW1_TOXGG|nr:hypothetical protein TGGT1_297300 [Toxoplasma gondii GT1]KAF4645727.1 hypothetical protein TGRH88_002130 [Toxoplasma gondii]KFG39833.1 hypothetical protein TGFOU_297300 [Toxoplasma gondii FOU]KFH04558.1 hypothetical protein TGMAS_297300 [Toxoplasma gondii MAS]PUA84696.1 hypothetical protein TGBR9_297300 [Toxoplasma gondii TgCATBr9]RQX67430.1 hypothetical protein TGCAST_297300 [Toxoplasma gondii CAST]
MGGGLHDANVTRIRELQQRSSEGLVAEQTPVNRSVLVVNELRDDEQDEKHVTDGEPADDMEPDFEEQDDEDSVIDKEQVEDAGHGPEEQLVADEEEILDVQESARQQ